MAPAAYPSLAALPLKEGYATTFRNFDVMKQKASMKQAKVTALEDVTVPAGSFKAWKVEITSADGEPGQQTVWIDTVSRKVVKVSATLPPDEWRGHDRGAGEVRKKREEERRRKKKTEGKV